MNEKHYKKQLSAFVNHELTKEEQQTIAEHLLQCADCRKEHDEIKFGAMLASRSKRADAPQSVWNKIEKSLNEDKQSKVSLTERFSFFKSPAFVITLSTLFIISGLISIVIYSNFNPQPDKIAENEPQISNSNIETLPKNPTAWNVETLAGTPQTGDEKISNEGSLAVGEILETDANSRARIEVADIGDVEIEPNSRVKLVNTNPNEHRLSLERGVLQARILAPPRLFIVDTPSAVAVDLGCEYTLEVDKDGNNKLHVTSGFVALERNGRESIVPAGAMCLTKKGKGLGTPFLYDASPAFRNAIFKFDFENGGSKSLQTIIKESEIPDSLTLWHLLSRVPENDREKVFNALSKLVKPPADVTKDGVLKLNDEMLKKWWIEIENVFFE